MNFKIISKNNVGVALVLLLAILLSQTRFLNFMVNTPLGRAFFIVILLFVSYINKILGVVCVLLFIIMFNNSDAIYLEGATTMTASNKQQNGTTSITDSPATSTPTIIPVTTAAPVTATPVTPVTTASASPLTTTTTTSATPTSPTSTANSNILGNVSSGTTNTAQEGFDIIGKERNLQRGRNSNSIPVNDFMKDSTNVAPYEGSSFSESFTIY